VCILKNGEWVIIPKALIREYGQTIAKKYNLWAIQIAMVIICYFLASKVF